jgi:hypothetical protein
LHAPRKWTFVVFGKTLIVSLTNCLDLRKCSGTRRLAHVDASNRRGLANRVGSWSSLRKRTNLRTKRTQKRTHLFFSPTNESGCSPFSGNQLRWDIAQAFILLYLAVTVPLRIGFSLEAHGVRVLAIVESFVSWFDH